MACFILFPDGSARRGILVPAAYFLVALFLPRKWSSRISWSFSAILALMIYIQIQAMKTTGSYISLHNRA